MAEPLNVKLLPRGLPEIIAQLAPYDIYPDTKVIACPRKEPHGDRGEVYYDGANYRVKIFPDAYLAIFGLHPLDGTLSFALWSSFLKTALHELGHLATRPIWLDMRSDYLPYPHWYVEEAAERWAGQAMARILSVDPRLGQPPGFITGYAGIKAYEWLNSWPDFKKLEEFRGLRCGGQVTIGVVASQAISHLLGPTWEMEDKSRARLERIARDQVHRAANNLGIQRYAFSANGRRYLMFNVGEAEAVYKWLVANKSVLVDAYRMLTLQQQQPVEPSNGNW